MSILSLLFAFCNLRHPQHGNANYSHRNNSYSSNNLVLGVAITIFCLGKDLAADLARVMRLPLMLPEQSSTNIVSEVTVTTGTSIISVTSHMFAHPSTLFVVFDNITPSSSSIGSGFLTVGSSAAASSYTKNSPERLSFVARFF